MAAEQFQVDLRGIVEILSHHLYSSPRVYLRELIQNARDAIAARRLLGPGAPERIEIVTDGARGELTIRDSGIGLTGDEMSRLLATIGASSKRSEFETARADFLGQFGIGLLSCFLIAEEIEVVSRSARTPDATTMRWVGNSNGTYTIQAAPEPLPEPGTVVRLVARVDDRDWVRFERVRLLAIRFASLLDLPVHLREAGDPAPGVLASRRTPPWAGDWQHAEEWCADEFGFRPLAQVPIAVASAGVRGVAYVSPTAGRIGSRTGDVVFCRGMFLSSDNTQLAPPWAFFVRLAIECGDLAPTASRESLQDTALLAHVREEIGEQIRRGIERLADLQPEAFAAVLDVHGEGMRAMAVSDDAMLDFVIDRIRWETSEGPRTLAEMRRDGRDIWYVRRVGEFTTYAPFMRASQRLLVNGGYVYGREILERFGSRWSNRDARPRPFRLSAILDELPVPDAADRAVADAVRRAVGASVARDGADVEVRAFRPSSLPVLYAPADRGPAPRFEESDADGGGGDVWAQLSAGLGDALGRPPEAEPLRPRLILNLDSPMIRALGTASRPEVAGAAAEVVRFLGRLLSDQDVHDDDTAHLTEAVTALLHAADDRRSHL